MLQLGVSRRAAVVAVLAVACAGAAAVARPAVTVAGALQPQPGSGQFRFSDADTDGTVSTRVIPAAVDPGDPFRFVVDIDWKDGHQNQDGCAPETSPAQTTPLLDFGLVLVRPGHGEDYENGVRNQGGPFVGIRGSGTQVNGPLTDVCGRSSDHLGFDARVPAAVSATLKPGCYAFWPWFGNWLNLLSEPRTFDGTFALLSVGGVDCATGAAPASAQAFTDTFSTDGQAKPHAVAVPERRTRAELRLTWAKPTDRFTVAGVVLKPKRKTSSAGRTTKVRITFFSVTATSLGVRVSGLTPGTLSFRVVGKKVSPGAKVRSRVVFKV